MALKKIFFPIVLLVFILVSFSYNIFAGDCLCGIRTFPSNYPVNYNYIKTVDSENISECDAWCYDEDGDLREECYDEGNYTRFVLCFTEDKCYLSDYLSKPNPNLALDNDLACTQICPFGSTECPIEFNADKDFKVCSYILNGNELNNPKVFADKAEGNNGCCGDDKLEDIGYRAENSKFACVMNSTRYKWIHAGQNEFKIFTVEKPTKDGTLSYDIVSNAEKWFFCEPGKPLIGPDITVDVLKPSESLTGYQSLQQGIITTTLGDLGLQTSQTTPVFQQTQTTSEIIEFANFGSDFRTVEEGAVSTFDKDGDGFISFDAGGTDCNDLDPTIYPGAFDPCGDSIDQDCDKKSQLSKDGAFCQPVDVTLNIPDVASRFICYNEEDKGTFAECCGYDLNLCYNQVPKGRRQGAVLTTIEEFQEGCTPKKNCVQEFGLIPQWGGSYYSFDIPLDNTDSSITNWTKYDSFEFFIYLADDYVVDIMVLGSQYQGDGTHLDDYTLLLHKQVTEYVVNSPGLGKWMHVIIPINDGGWILEPTNVKHIILYSDTQKVRAAGTKTKAIISGNNLEWENVIGLDRLFLRPENPNYCIGTNKPKWINDLDDSTLDQAGQQLGRIACQDTPTFGWTGTQCCGDDTTKQNKEYFRDNLAGCWNGETLTNDLTTTNIEYQLSYNLPNYELNPELSEEQHKFKFDLEVSQKDINLQEKTIFEGLDLEISQKESPKLVADFGTNINLLDYIFVWQPAKDNTHEISYTNDMCPEGTVGCGIVGEEKREYDGWEGISRCSFTFRKHITQLACCDTELEIDTENKIEITRHATCPTADNPGENMCPNGYVVCGITRGHKEKCDKDTYYIDSYYCCPVKGLYFGNITPINPSLYGSYPTIDYDIINRSFNLPSTVDFSPDYPYTSIGEGLGEFWEATPFDFEGTFLDIPGLFQGLWDVTLGTVNTIFSWVGLGSSDSGRQTGYSPAPLNKLICGFCGFTSGNYNWPNQVTYCSINNPTEAKILNLKYSPEDPRLRVFFKTSNASYSYWPLDKIFAEYNNKTVYGGYEVIPTGRRSVTETFTVTCKSNKCIYPLPGQPPYNLNNLHTEEYNLTIDQNKRIIIAERVPQRIKFYNSTFYGCFAPNYLFEYGVELNNSAQACDILGLHFCSPSQGWNNRADGAPNASSRNTIKSTPAEYSINSTSCCPSNYCWNSTACVASETNSTSLLKPLIEGDYTWRCLDGNWSFSVKRYTWDFSQSGYCPTRTQCLVNPTGISSLNNQPETYDPTSKNNPQCIESGQFIEDHYCFNGTWTSRTKLIAIQLLDIVNRTGDIDNYTLFCDNYKNSLVDFNYLSIEDYLRGKLFAKPPVSIYTCAANTKYVMPCVNNFCVVKYEDIASGEQKVVFGTSLNRPIDNSDFTFLKTLDQPANYCSDLIGTKSNYNKCSNNPNIWYSDATNSIIFSRSGVIVGELSVLDSFVRFLYHPIKSIINFVVDVIAPRAQPSGAVIDYNFTKNTKEFSQIYINRLYTISIKAIIESPQMDKRFITIKYEGVPENICLAVSIYDKAHPPSGKISCNKINSTYYVISDQKTALNIWTEFTSQLRPNYSP